MTKSLLYSTLSFPTWTKGTPENAVHRLQLSIENHSGLQAHHQAKVPGTEHLPLELDPGLQKVVRVGNNTSATLTLNTGAPQGSVLSPLLYSLFTHNCVAAHDSNTIIKFDDDTRVVGLITNNDELIMDYRKQRAEHTPIHIAGL
jgi:hypothetical protein